MATKSALKTVYIKNPVTANKLVRALENAKGKSSIEVEMKRSVSAASREEIRKMFGNNDGVQDR